MALKMIRARANMVEKIPTTIVVMIMRELLLLALNMPITPARKKITELNIKRHYVSPPVVQLDISTYTPQNYSRGTYFMFTCMGQGDRSTKLLRRHGLVHQDMHKETVKTG